MPARFPESLCPQGDEARSQRQSRGRPAPQAHGFPEVALTQEPGRAGGRELGRGSRAGQRLRAPGGEARGLRGAGEGPWKAKTTLLTRLGHGVWSAYCGQGTMPSTPYIHSFIHSVSLSRASSWARCHVGGWEPHDDQESHKWSCHPEHCPDRQGETRLYPDVVGAPETNEAGKRSVRH